MLSYEQVMNITGSTYNYLGLNNTYNAKILLAADYNKTAFHGDYLTQVQQAWGLNQTQLTNMFETMEHQIEGYLYGGSVVTRNISEIVLGYNNARTLQWNEKMRG